MADPSILLGEHHEPQQNGFQNGSGGIDPSMLLLNPISSSSQLPTAEPLAISISAQSSSSANTISPSALHQPPMPAPPPPPSSSGPQKFMRPFAFGEALPYSPFTSISPLETRTSCGSLCLLYEQLLTLVVTQASSLSRHWQPRQLPTSYHSSSRNKSSIR